MRNESREVLNETLQELKEGERLCQELYDLVDGNRHDLDPADFDAEAPKIIDQLSYAYATRAQQVEDQLEALNNRAMDNFRNRKIT